MGECPRKRRHSPIARGDYKKAVLDNSSTAFKGNDGC